jgi:hypothetical protein
VGPGVAMPMKATRAKISKVWVVMFGLPCSY